MGASGARALARRAFADARTRTLSFAALFAFASYLQATAYRTGYPTLEDRIRFARGVGGNTAARLLYGEPHDLLTVGGYVAWRIGGGLAIFAGVWGLLGAVRAMRTEEEAGRAELVLAGIVGRRRALLAQLVAIAAGASILWLATFFALAAGHVPIAGAAFVALAIVSVVPVFVGVGALASQLASTRRLAIALATAVLLLALALRTAAAAGPPGWHWLRWTTPLGWAGELRPFADPQPLVLVLPILTGAVLLVAAAALATRRDIGRGVLPARDSAPAHLLLLGSPVRQAARIELGSLMAWLAGVGAFALLMGVTAGAVTPDVLSESVRERMERLGTGAIATPSGWLGFAFALLVPAVSVFACVQLSAIRAEEANQRLETLLALPVDRRDWLAGRLLLATAGVTTVALSAGALAWIGAVIQGADVPLSSMVGAGGNCLPTALLFLGLGSLAYSVAPRQGTAIAYGLVAVAFVWEMAGALLGAPGWLLTVSPFHHVGLVPGHPFRAADAAVMLAVGALAGVIAVSVFRRRDLVAA